MEKKGIGKPCKYWWVTSAGFENGVTAKVGDLDHHAVVNHTVGWFETTVDLKVAGVEVGHALNVIIKRQKKLVKIWISIRKMQLILILLLWKYIQIKIPLLCHTWLISWTPCPWRFRQDKRSYHSECTGSKRSYFFHFYCPAPCTFASMFARWSRSLRTASAYQRDCGDIATSGERRPQRSHVNSYVVHNTDRWLKDRHFWMFKEQKVWESHTQTSIFGPSVIWTKGCNSHPERSSLAQLKHPEHTVLELDGAVEFGQVVVIDP